MSDHKHEMFHQAAAKAAEMTGAERCVVIAELQPGVYGIVSHGFTRHAEVNDALVLGIHMNMNDHDRLVLAGMAGEQAQQQAAHLGYAPTPNLASMPVGGEA